MTAESGFELRAPVVSVETPVHIENSAGASYDVSVLPTAPPSGYPEGMAAGCVPFAHGVASGDPTSDRVLLWTRVTADADLAVQWEVATDAAFDTIVAQGEVTATAASDHTVQVEASGLDPATTYYYRFVADGSRSEVGRTRTAPGPGTDAVRLAVVSCSSIYSGFFNAYRRIAERDELDLLVHVGDYIYDFPDEDELIRIPDPFPESPNDLASWRATHAYHLTDPDLRAARAAHPWIMLWDNHDVDAGRRPRLRGERAGVPGVEPRHAAGRPGAPRGRLSNAPIR